MKKIVALLLGVAVVFSFAGCSGAADDESTDTGASTASESESEISEAEEESSSENEISGLKVGFSDMADDEASWVLKDAFKEYWEALDCEVVLLSANSDTDEQLQNCEDLITQECDVLVVRPVSDDIIATVAESCANNGVTLFTLDVAEESLTDDVNLNLVYRDHYALGVAQANYLIEQLENDPDLTINLCYIYMSTTITAAQLREQGVVETLQPYVESGRVTILDEQSLEGDVAKVSSTMENWFVRFSDMNCVVCPNDAIAISAIAALEAYGADFDEWYVCGIDGDDAAYDYLASGKLDMTAANSAAESIQADCEIMVRYLQGEDLSGTVDPAVEAEIISIDNYEEYYADK